MSDYTEQLGSNREYTLRLSPHLREFLLFALDRWVEGGKNCGEAACIRAALMNEGNEPLFDSLKHEIVALREYCEKVERERDEWRAECHKRTEEMHQQHAYIKDLSQKHEQMKRLCEMHSQLEVLRKQMAATTEPK